MTILMAQRAASGQLGYGVPTPAFQAGLAREPDINGCDMGSIDIGPYYLGAGRMATARQRRGVTCARLFWRRGSTTSRW
jgi:hypothetical protein